MKSKRFGLLCFLLSLFLLLSGCIQPTETVSPPETTDLITQATTEEIVTEQQTTAPTYFYESMQYQYKTDVTASINYFVTNLDSEYLILANKTHSLEKNYAPLTTVRLTCPTYYGKEVELESRAAQALYAMLAEMLADGVTDIYVTSGYRTYEYQETLYQQYITKEKSTLSEQAYAFLGEAYIKTVYLDNDLTGLTHLDAERVVQSYSAMPGTSEHQTGLCVDFVTSNVLLEQAFENTQAFLWLSQNAYRFGFILRYPSNKTEVTGYTYEPWHYRFVGREAATEIHFRNLSLEEFLETAQ